MGGFARIHVLGASCCGTTTLGRALATQSGAQHLDTDDFYWAPTDPPYRQARPLQDRVSLLRAAMEETPAWVLSGSMVPWGDVFIERLDLVIFLTVPTEERVRRLRAREVARYGVATLAPGGAMHEQHLAFVEWAAAYDEGGLQMRSRARHEDWLGKLACPVIRLDGELPTAVQVQVVGDWMAAG
ncbi:AAA family ATPase [Uliginosibacterium sp. sgz301328]|uniref:AAA family ATPase n=1 Tax=Uliginosibacterium sp. sgz301328 TaxID=3243764 RepID=UPI00359D235A